MAASLFPPPPLFSRSRTHASSLLPESLEQATIFSRKWRMMKLLILGKDDLVL